MIQLNRRDMMTAGAAFAAVPLIGAGTAEPGWEKLPTEAYPGKRDDISFADPLHGWYGTGKGDLFRTTDGGASWAKVASKPGTFGYSDEGGPHHTIVLASVNVRPCDMHSGCATSTCGSGVCMKAVKIFSR